jgi:adenine-specific DNA-methyltransferase
MARIPKGPKQVGALTHDEARRRNIPTAEMESFFRREEDVDPRSPVNYPRARPLAQGESRERDEDLDPQIIWNGARLRLSRAQVAQLAETGEVEIGDAQLVWRGKDRQDWSDLVVQVPPLYIQEKVHPKAIIDDLKRRSEEGREASTDAPDLFANFNGLPKGWMEEGFYQHDQHWSNRFILGDSLQVMASLAEREALRGKVQCIYFDPPYGIKFASNWQVSTQSRDIREGKQTDISREPEQVKAFRDTWKDNIHSYLTYLRDRLTVMRDLLTDSGSIFVQIGDENVHRVRTLMDEVFGADNFISLITVQKTTSFPSSTLASVSDYLVWFSKKRSDVKVRSLFDEQPYRLGEGNARWVELPDFRYRGVTAKEASGAIALPPGARPYKPGDLSSQGRSGTPQPFSFGGVDSDPFQKNAHWKANYPAGMHRLRKANRIHVAANSFQYKRFHTDYPWTTRSNIWTDTGTGSFTDEKIYVVQTGTKTVERCVQMTTDPGDLVLDPTCGSGTTAYVAEQWGRRWVTIDTSRVALALARTRLMSARYPWYLLADSAEGARKEGELANRAPEERPFRDDIRQGFVYERVPHIMLRSIANNPRVDDIWDKWAETLEPLRASLNAALDQTWEEWQLPRDPSADWPDAVKMNHAEWWEARVERQREMDETIAAAADVELLYDKPISDPNRVRVAGPFTVESLSPHRVLPASEIELIDEVDAAEGKRVRAGSPETDFAQIVLEHLRTNPIQQGEKGDRITFQSVQPWPGQWIGGEATFLEGPEGAQVERRAAIFIGPQYGTVGRSDLVAAAREAVDARFDLVVACAFNFDAHSSELGGLGALRIVKARINPDMHMAGELKNNGKGNMFIVFGEPDIDILDDGGETIRVKVNGVDVFDPNTGTIRSNDTKGIAAWFVDTDYDEESFFVRHAYFLGASDPYKNLRTALRAEIDEEAWATLYSDTSRPFPRPSSGRIAVKVINHFGDEVMKVFGV